MLMRWDPFGELDRLTRGASGNMRSSVPIDAFRRRDEFVIHFDVPGVDRGTIDLTVQDNVLTLRAERRTPLDEYDEVLLNERSVGTFTRQLFLGKQLDTAELRADYASGVLTVTIPVAEAAKPRRIEIGDKSKAITAGQPG